MIRAHRKSEGLDKYKSHFQNIKSVSQNLRTNHGKSVCVFFRYDELREKSQNLLLPVDKRVSDMIIKLQTFAHMDNKTVPYAKVIK